MDKPLFRSPDELNARLELFRDPNRTDEDNRGPFLVVHDGFYDDPHGIRALALEQEFYQYGPPSADQVGPEKAARYLGQRPRSLRHGMTLQA